MRQSFNILIGLALAGVAFAAPVPKSKDIDPGKTWEFPDLDSKGWVKCNSGLKMWDVKEGEGDAVKASDAVKVRYVLWLTDGKKVDGDPQATTTFTLSALIKGWGEGAVGMKPGGIRRLMIPPELAYGKNGAGDQIPGNATLVFTIEYLGPGDK